MKCLENLSLVDDECLDDLQKDIAKLIESYINVGKCCEETFKKLKNSLKPYQIKQIVSILCDVDTFIGHEPIRIYKDDIGKEVAKFLFFELEEEKEESIDEIMYMFREFSLNDARDFDFRVDAFWIYRDGANGALHMEREDYFLNLIEEQLSFEETCTQLEILRYLKRVEKNVIQMT